MVDLTSYEEIIIWGASFPPTQTEGDATSHGRAIESVADILRKYGIWENVIAIVDSNKGLHGRKRLGIEVKDPQFILQHPQALVIINTISIWAIEKCMINAGICNDYVIIPYYFYHGTVEHPYRNDVAKKDAENNKNKIYSLYNVEDELTKKYLDIILEMRLAGEDKLYEPQYYEGTSKGIAYFCDEELAPKGLVTYIDVGAYDGNSIEPINKYYGNRLERIVAFEPDNKSRADLSVYLKEKNLDKKTLVLPYALGSENKQIRFSTAGQMGQIDEKGNVILEQRRFDDLEDLHITGEAMVKMDIEGAEMGALQGMNRFISDNLPYLAICIYHKESDLCEVAEFIKNINSDYKLYIRGGWHLECWAVPKRHFE